MKKKLLLLIKDVSSLAGRKLLAGILSFAVVYGVWKVLDWQADKYKQAETAASVYLSKIIGENNIRFAQMQAEQAVIRAENARLRLDIAAKDAAIKKREDERKKDHDDLDTDIASIKTEELQKVVDRWVANLKVEPLDITIPEKGPVQVTETATRLTVVNLSKLPVLERDVASLTKDKADMRVQITDYVNITAGKDKELALALEREGRKEEQYNAEKDVWKSEKKAILAEGRRGKFNWFIRGAVVGGGVVAIVVATSH